MSDCAPARISRPTTGIVLFVMIAASAIIAAAPAADTLAADWPSYNRTLTSERYAPFDQINRTNAARLKRLCVYDLNVDTSFQTGPIGFGPLEARAKPMTPENPVPRRLYAAMPLYPVDAPADARNVTIAFRITLDQSGRVAEVRALSGTVLPVRAAEIIQGRGGRGRGGVVPSPTVVGPSTAGTGAFSRAATDAIRQWVYEPPADGPIAFDVTISFSPDSEAQLVSHGALFRAVPAGRRGASPPPAGQEPQSLVNDVVRVGGGVAIPTKVKNVDPVYPPIAAAAGVQGVVILEARIGPDGHVADARVLRSIPLLDQSAIDAALQWEYTPTLLNGSAVSVLMTVTVNFAQ